MNAYHIEPIDERYNKEMLEILRSSPITTSDITMYFDRQPSIFKLAKIKYRPHYYFGFFLLEKLKGFGMIGYHDAMVNGVPETVFHLKDFYVTADARGKGFGYRTAERLFSETHDQSTFGYAVVMAGNKAPLHYVGNRKSSYPYIPYSRIINQLDVRNILLILPVKKETSYHVRPALPDDVPAMVSLLNSEHKQRLFGNVYSEGKFQKYLENCPGLEINDYYLAFDRKGKLSGVCAAWDCSSFKQTRVLAYGIRFHPARLLYKSLAVVFGCPPLPASGESFKDFIVTDYAVRDRDPGAMNALLRSIYRDRMMRGYQNMIWGSSIDDPLLKASKGFFYQRVVSNIVLVSTDPNRMENGAVNNHLPYIDIPCL
jgi:GNAT superfamily N-acetyltransferase